MSHMDLRIGIENEMFLKGPGNPPPDFAKKWQIEKYVNDHLLKFYNDKKHGTALLRADFSHGSHPGHHNSHNNTGQWTVTTDDAIGELDLNGNTPGVGKWPLEFVSPILEFNERGTWREEVKNHWATVLDFGEVCIDIECATHVHISPEVGKKWNLMQLKAVARAVLYFEESFKAVVAPSRREHAFSMFNRADNRHFKNADFERCRTLIGECVDVDELVSLMQPPDSHNANVLPDRHYAWNFQETMEGDENIGTIEFRCAPGVQTAEHCLIWVELAAFFVRQAAHPAHCENMLFLENTYRPDGEGLFTFLHDGRFRGMEEGSFWAIPFLQFRAPLKNDEEMRCAFAEKLKAWGLGENASWAIWENCP